MAKAHKVVSLISGGKDSLYSILHCLANGHEVVALANLHPPAAPDSARHGQASDVSRSERRMVDDDDLESHMYQTVGHSVIPLYEEALSIPLYRREIRGSAINTEKSYPALPLPSEEDDDDIKQPGGRRQDETEDLLEILQHVVRHHPEVDAVSNGAILSDYQRTRVESVATRLGLVPLSFLWQYPRLPPNTAASLLADMEAVEQEARIIKCASAGLDATFLWENVATKDAATKLAKAMHRYGASDIGAVLGEGGEYETLALDGPGPLWKKRIVVDDDDRVIVHSGGGSSFLRITRARLAMKPDAVVGDRHSSVRPRIPGLLDPDFEGHYDYLKQLEWPAVAQPFKAHDSSYHACQDQATWCIRRGKTALYIWNVTAPDASPTAEGQMSAVAARLKAFLQREQVSPDDITFTAIYLRTMEAFPIVNDIYGALFSRPNPPARMTVGLGASLPPATEVMISINVWRGPRHLREGLHVQSRSYWAPANIGPYSQAVAVPAALQDDGQTRVGTVVHLAGQIPLVPASIELVGATPEGVDDESIASFILPAVLSLQHLWRVGTAMKVSWWANAIVFIAGTTNIAQKACVASRLWERCHTRPDQHESDAQEEDEENFDLWDKTYGKPSRSLDQFESSHGRRLPDFDSIHNRATITASRPPPPPPPLLIIQVEQLPRSSAIEWTATGLAEAQVILSEHHHKGLYRLHKTIIHGAGVGFMHATFEDDNNDELDDQALCELIRQVLESETASLTLEGLKGSGAGKEKGEGEGKEVQVQIQALLVTIYIDRRRGLSTMMIMPAGLENVETIRCSGVWDGKGRRLAAALTVRFELEHHDDDDNDNDDDEKEEEEEDSGVL